MKKCQKTWILGKEKIIKCDFQYQNERKTSQQKFQKKSPVSNIHGSCGIGQMTGAGHMGRVGLVMSIKGKGEDVLKTFGFTDSFAEWRD